MTKVFGSTLTFATFVLAVVVARFNSWYCITFFETLGSGVRFRGQRQVQGLALGYNQGQGQVLGLDLPENFCFSNTVTFCKYAGRQAALHDGPVGCTVSWAAEKGGPESCPFLQPAPPFSAARRPALLSSVQSAESLRFSFRNTSFQPARPAGPPISVIHMIKPISQIFLVKNSQVNVTNVADFDINVYQNSQIQQIFFCSRCFVEM